MVKYYSIGPDSYTKPQWVDPKKLKSLQQSRKMGSLEQSSLDLIVELVNLVMGSWVNILPVGM